jgi:hypothetical protein
MRFLANENFPGTACNIDPKLLAGHEMSRIDSAN